MSRNCAQPLRCATFCSEPVRKLSTATTAWPSASRRSHMCEPMNPAAPDRNDPELRATVEMRHILFGAGEEIVNSHHRMALRQQAIAHVRADESGGSGNQNAQAKYPVRLICSGLRGPLCYIQRLPHGPPFLAGNRDPGDTVVHLRIAFLAPLPQAGGCNPPLAR